MLESKVYCNSKYKIGDVDPRLFGSFVEHMGRVVYSGIYEPENPCADSDGFRTDVLEKTKEMGVTTVRYPGGNFVSSYCWEDGVGPREKRPQKLDLAWKSLETNEFGTDEFCKWSEKAGIQPIFTVNLGTRGMSSALAYLEYCNFDKGTYYSEMRRKNGREKPYGIHTWCLGNEMDGEWQIGHKTSMEYARLAAETAHAMKILDPDIELIACGSSLSTMPTFPQWDMDVLEQAYDSIDYLALHQYYGGQENGTKEFLAQTKDMEDYIHTVRSAAQVIKRKKKSDKQMKFSMDEWGVWAVPSAAVNEEIEHKTWQVAPAISEQIYTLEDALLFAGMQMVMLRNADVIRIACQSLLTNISSCIMTERGGGLWVQTIYYPFRYFAKYARGDVLHTIQQGPAYECLSCKEVPFLDQVVVLNTKEKEAVIYLVNRSEDEDMRVTVYFEDLLIAGIREFSTMTADDKKATNRECHDRVVPKQSRDIDVGKGLCTAKIPPMSFSVIRLSVE